MTRPLALLRPEPGWSASAAAARLLGMEVVGHPMFQADPVAWSPPSGDFDAVLAGSAAAFRMGGEGLLSLAHLPVHAVGEATAEAARAASFTVARTGTGGLQQLLDMAADRPMRFLRLAGSERVTLAPHKGQHVIERIVYRMVPVPLDTQFAEVLGMAHPIVALHSAAGAAHFAAEVERIRLARSSMVLLALGPRIAQATGPGWAAVHMSDFPNDAALLAKAKALCE